MLTCFRERRRPSALQSGAAKARGIAHRRPAARSRLGIGTSGEESDVSCIRRIISFQTAMCFGWQACASLFELERVQSLGWQCLSFFGGFLGRAQLSPPVVAGPSASRLLRSEPKRQEGPGGRLEPRLAANAPSEERTRHRVLSKTQSTPRLSRSCLAGLGSVVEPQSGPRCTGAGNQRDGSSGPCKAPAPRHLKLNSRLC